MTALLKPETSRPEDVFQDFFRSFQTDPVGSKYRKHLAQVAVNNGRSLVIDFEDLISFDSALARSVVEHPDEYIGHASSAATTEMRVEDPEYAEQVGRIFARFRGLSEKIPLHKLGVERLKKLVLVEGTVSRLTQPRPEIVYAIFRCKKCLEIIREEQTGGPWRGPGSHCPSCKQRSVFDLLEEQSRFRNTQEARIQEVFHRKLRRGESPRQFDLKLEDDLVDSVEPGDRISLTAVVRAKPFPRRRPLTREFSLYLEANHVELMQKRTETKSGA